MSSRYQNIDRNRSCLAAILREQFVSRWSEIPKLRTVQPSFSKIGNAQDAKSKVQLFPSDRWWFLSPTGPGSNMRRPQHAVQSSYRALGRIWLCPHTSKHHEYKNTCQQNKEYSSDFPSKCRQRGMEKLPKRMGLQCMCTACKSQLSLLSRPRWVYPGLMWIDLNHQMETIVSYFAGYLA